MANENKRLSGQGRAALTHAEALRQAHYNDQGHNCTVGAGTLVHYGPCTAADSAAPPMPMQEIMLHESQGIERAERLVRAAVNRHELTQEQFDRAVSFVYNVGLTKPLLPANSGNMAEVARQMNEYVYVCDRDQQGRRIPGRCHVSGGLINRRRAESAPFRGGQP